MWVVGPLSNDHDDQDEKMRILKIMIMKMMIFKLVIKMIKVK